MIVNIQHINSDDYPTPQEFFKILDDEFHFNDDPCPLRGDLFQDGLSREWGSNVFMNPPYSNPLPWCMRAYHESQNGKTIVGLLRGDTSTEWFHKWVLPYAEIRFIRGRLKFKNEERAPFANILVIWRPC